MRGRKKRLGDILIESGVISRQMLSDALETQRVWGGKLGRIMVSLGYIDELLLVNTLSLQLNIPSITLDNIVVSEHTLKTIPPLMISKFKILPITFTDNTLTVAFSDQSDLTVLEDFSRSSNLKIKKVITTPDELNTSIDFHLKFLGEDQLPIEQHTTNLFGFKDRAPKKDKITGISSKQNPFDVLFKNKHHQNDIVSDISDFFQILTAQLDHLNTLNSKGDEENERLKKKQLLRVKSLLSLLMKKGVEIESLLTQLENPAILQHILEI